MSTPTAAFDRLRGICLDAVAQGVVPGLAVAAGKDGATQFAEAFGQRQVDPPGAAAPATVDTIYDLASLTKALCTSVLAMQGVARGRLLLDEEVGSKPSIPIRDLLGHTAGFPAHRDLWRDTLPHPEAALDTLTFDLDAVVAAAAATPFEYAPRTRSVYSDLGFIVLGAALEHALGARLDRLFADRIAHPLGLFTMGFRDLAHPGARTVGPAIAATERCPHRKRVLVGEVHDLNAFAMGGVAGHAGLFGTVGDVAAIAHALCRAYHGESSHGATPFVDRDVLSEFWRGGGVPGSTWYLGWDRPSPTASLAGERLSRNGVGHLGFTGCSLWIDPRAATFVVMLSNRVHPTVRDDPRFRALRPALNDAALDAAGYRAA